MPRHGVAVALHKFIEPDGSASLGQDRLKPDLPALQRIASQIAASVRSGRRRTGKCFRDRALGDPIERSHAVVNRDNRSRRTKAQPRAARSFSVDDAGPQAQGGCLEDQDKTIVRDHCRHGCRALPPAPFLRAKTRRHIVLKLVHRGRSRCATLPLIHEGRLRWPRRLFGRDEWR